MITLNYTLGVYPAYNGTVAKLSQYSNDFTLIFTLTNDYGDFVLEDGTTAQIRGTKADGNGYSANCTIDIEAQTVTVTGDEQITAAAGDNTFEIRLIKNEKILNTVNFTIWVERAALDAGTITSDSVLLELNAIIEGAQTATEAAASASASAEAAATSAATLRLDPTLTQSGESADAKVVGDALASGLAARYDSASPYAVGDYMLKDNVLYHVTRAIPAGGAVTVGTNVEIAPLGNAVTALNSKWSMWGKAIANGSDMDNITDPGFYYSANSAVSASLSNCPHKTSGFAVIVPPGPQQMQLIIVAGVGGDLYHRSKSSAGWNSWFRFTGTRVS